MFDGCFDPVCGRLDGLNLLVHSHRRVAFASSDLVLESCNKLLELCVGKIFHWDCFNDGCGEIVDIFYALGRI